MKTSRIVLWSGAAFLALLIILALILMKISITRDLGTPPETVKSVRGESIEVSVDTSGVTALYLKGGLGSVSYGGTVSEERIRTEGIASVKRR